MGVSAERLGDFRINNIDLSPRILHAIHCIVEGYEVYQAFSSVLLLIS